MIDGPEAQFSSEPHFQLSVSHGVCVLQEPHGWQEAPCGELLARGPVAARGGVCAPRWTGGARDVARGDATGQTRVSEQPVFRRKEAKQEAELRPPPACPPPRPAVLFLTTSQPSAGTCSARRRTPVPAPGSGGGRGLPSVRLCSPPRDTCIYYVNVDP